MLLIFNTIIDEKARRNFTEHIAERITFGYEYDVITLEDDLPDFSKYSQLLLSGSELSASKGSKWDAKIMEVIRIFIKGNKAILGICHGHQMLARTIAGDAVCKQCAQPEYGWNLMNIAKNRIFENVPQPIFIQSHYDEIYNLDDRFEIIAWNDLLPIQAFQLKNRPVWGLQFHPEMLWEDGNKMIENHLQQHPKERKYWKNEMKDIDLIPTNLNIFRNFLHATPA
jgi:GMP synthase (glutamine-hydrolysing)